ncbi:MAG: ABC transporter ATP-binding protein [Hadesarchaea archaeon YNP_N21]|jgi:branched-chain amino acid transport system ATP-binding protein|nr:MAG: ABC transporter ATP-binding protein [Hadesarchaea archaeon YNP_N21]
MIVLDVQNVSKKFGGLWALKKVSLQIKKGEIVGIIGPNGSGKTTLINVITKFLTPDEGKIVYNGEDITKLPCHEIAQKGIVRTFQIVRPFSNLTVLDNVTIGTFSGKSVDKLDVAREEARRILKQVGLLDKEKILAGKLTSPERKRLELAKALAMNPNLLLLDETLAGLTISEIDELLEFIESLREDRKITIAIVEHVMRAIMGISDRIIVLASGEKIAEGSPSAIAKNKLVKEIYLGESKAK